jgi:G-protein alpha subunit
MAANFHAHLDRRFASDYIPTNQDILHSRHHECITFEAIFNVGGLHYHVFGAGGFRSERQGWARLVDDADIVLFHAGLGSYDERLFECESAVSLILRQELLYN